MKNIDKNFNIYQLLRIIVYIYIWTNYKKTMYTGNIYYQGNPITVQEAVNLNLITVDSNGDIWLKNDENHMVTITGDLRLG